MFNDLLLEAAVATLIRALTKDRWKPKVRAVALRLFRVIRLTYGSDPEFQ
jgi:hypothetical protein